MRRYFSGAWFHRACHQQERGRDSHYWARLFSVVSASGCPSTILEPSAGKTETFAEIVYKHQPMINFNDLALLQPMVAFIRKCFVNLHFMRAAVYFAKTPN